MKLSFTNFWLGRNYPGMKCASPITDCHPISIVSVLTHCWMMLLCNTWQAKWCIDSSGFAAFHLLHIANNWGESPPIIALPKEWARCDCQFLFIISKFPPMLLSYTPICHNPNGITLKEMKQEKASIQTINHNGVMNHNQYLGFFPFLSLYTQWMPVSRYLWSWWSRMGNYFGFALNWMGP